MIDLHLHLDGSLTPEDVRTLASLSGVTLPTKNDEELFSLLTARDTRSLSEYLEKFELPLSVLQSGEAVGLAVERLGDRLFDLGYSFAEIRFAPLLHLRRGASMRSIAEGALEGVKRSRLPIGLIFCCMRGAEKAKNEETIECAAEYKNAGVVGVDLAGAEALYPTENYRDIFRLAAKENLNITIHAGEAAGADSVRAALDFGAKRIGHGVAAAGDDALLERIKTAGVTIEICPTSNSQTGAIPSIAAHPVRTFLEKGVHCALSSDNMTVSDTDVFREWAKIKAAFSFDDSVKERLIRSAEAASFINGREKNA
ncbi:MAG: adenosine deaminase [Clostridia bacterium]|nr:adenosine deaminase [Clostridia bacterium]